MHSSSTNARIGTSHASLVNLFLETVGFFWNNELIFVPAPISQMILITFFFYLEVHIILYRCHWHLCSVTIPPYETTVFCLLR